MISPVRTAFLTRSVIPAEFLSVTESIFPAGIPSVPETIATVFPTLLRTSLCRTVIRIRLFPSTAETGFSTVVVPFSSVTIPVIPFAGISVPFPAVFSFVVHFFKYYLQRTYIRFSSRMRLYRRIIFFLIRIMNAHLTENLRVLNHPDSLQIGVVRLHPYFGGGVRVIQIPGQKCP